MAIHHASRVLVSRNTNFFGELRIFFRNCVLIGAKRIRGSQQGMFKSPKNPTAKERTMQSRGIDKLRRKLIADTETYLNRQLTSAAARARPFSRERPKGLLDSIAFSRVLTRRCERARRSRRLRSIYRPRSRSCMVLKPSDGIAPCPPRESPSPFSLARPSCDLLVRIEGDKLALTINA